jgi:sulfatase maturation enzyme AslB (radical SAM superfamily)
MKLINEWEKAIQGKIDAIQLKKEVQKNHPSLTSVVFTRECVLRCKHCVYPQANSCDLRLNNLTRIDHAIEATYQAGNRDLIHIGRILKKEHLPILKKYQNKGMTLNLIDNGFGKRLVEDIKKEGVFFAGGIDISVDGDKKSHEAQRGAGTWQLALDGIKTLQEVADHISVTGTASALNFDTITDGLLEVKNKFPFIKVLQITTTSPTNFQPQRMHLTAKEMKILFNGLLKISKKHPPRLLIYRVEDLAVIIDELMHYGKPQMKQISVEWNINNLTVAFFPESIVTAEEFGIDANGIHILPFGLDHHLGERPEKWEMRDDLILTNPDKSYEILVDKYYKMRGEIRLAQEKEIFKPYQHLL